MSEFTKEFNGWQKTVGIVIAGFSPMFGMFDTILGSNWKYSFLVGPEKSLIAMWSLKRRITNRSAEDMLLIAPVFQPRRCSL